MRVTRIESLIVAVPLVRPVLLSRQTFTTREFNVALVHTDEGHVGVGYGRGGALVHAAIAGTVAPLVTGRDPLAVESIWQDVYEATALVGRRGAVLRALSVVDIALWDVRAKAAGPSARPAARRRCRRRAGLRQRRLLPRGPDHRRPRARDGAVGRARVPRRQGARRAASTPAEDAARVEALRRGLGDGVSVAVDANQGLRDAAAAIDLGRRLEALGVRWLEEPLAADDVAGAGRVAAALDMPVAAGEVEQTRWAFRDLVAAGAADVLQPDVTVVGGVTEWTKVAALAEHPRAARGAALLHRGARAPGGRDARRHRRRVLLPRRRHHLLRPAAAGAARARATGASPPASGPAWGSTSTPPPSSASASPTRSSSRKEPPHEHRRSTCPAASRW